ncbi:MAG TPA: exosome complex protein Rrp42 [Candidatus Nanoarchaeia archaeon]|nr:exosome complex protein Rrp42 [Candidatus Nanoarchaeia archaeon]
MNNDYLLNLLEQGKRADGRKLEDYRKITIETGISKNAEGSARCKIGDTEVLAGVKMDVGTPYPDSPDEGSIIVTTELSPIASPDFELGPPGAWATEISRIVDRGIRESKAVDFKTLCIKPGEKCWLLFIDIYPLNDDGNLIDASMLAAMAALKQVKFLKLNSENKPEFGEHSTKKLQIKKETVTVTVYKAGKSLFVDCSNKEEEMIDARLSVSVDNGKIHAMQKGGAMAITLQEIETMIDLAMKKEKDLRKALDSVK